jgi:hypothetical protein
MERPGFDLIQMNKERERDAPLVGDKCLRASEEFPMKI